MDVSHLEVTAFDWKCIMYLTVRKKVALFQIMCHLVFLSRRPIRFNVGYYKLVKIHVQIKFYVWKFVVFELKKNKLSCFTLCAKSRFSDNTEVLHGISPISVPVILSIYLTWACLFCLLSILISILSNAFNVT